MANGYDVEIAAPLVEGTAELEHDGPLVIRRYRPSGRFAGLATTYQSPVPPGRARGSRGPPRRIVGIVRAVRAPPDVAWLFWPQTVRGWWHTLERELEPADLYHACGVLAIPAALAAAARDRRAGRRPAVIHDVIDLQLDFEQRHRDAADRP